MNISGDVNGRASRPHRRPGRPDGGRGTTVRPRASHCAGPRWFRLRSPVEDPSSRSSCQSFPATGRRSVRSPGPERRKAPDRAPRHRAIWPGDNSRTGNVNPVALDRLHMSRPFTGRTTRRDHGCRRGTCRWVPNSPRPSFNVRQRSATSAQQERANFRVSIGCCRRAAVSSCGGSC